jgi:hypothetical protein
VIASRIVRRNVLLSSLIAGLLILVAFGFSAYWRSPTRGLPYHDSFADGTTRMSAELNCSRARGTGKITRSKQTLCC